MAGPAESGDRPSAGESGADGRFDLLVVATTAVGPPELEQELRKHAAGREANVRIVSPAIVESQFQHAAGNVDDAIRRAQARLAESAQRLAEESIEIESFTIGDSDPILAIGDALRTAPADEILIVTHPEEASGWMESDLFDRARKRLDHPITHVTVNSGGSAPSIEEVETSGPGRDDPESVEVEPPLRTMPRMALRDVIGMAVAALGTFALLAIAANCVNEPSDAQGSNCTAQLLIAGAMSLINIAHLVGMLLFASVGYRGFPERFMARLSMIGTPLAVAAILIIASFD